ncbi:MAG: UDP-N-acetylmuramoyl-L-alanine--D-glutamate ligase [Syntrophomonas sp.]
MDFSGKRILVVGLARSGWSAINVLSKRGAVLSACDSKSVEKLGEKYLELKDLGVRLYAGSYPQVDRGDYDLLVVSPGVPLQIAPIKQAYEAGIPVIGEVELAFLLKAEGVEIYAITGTNGKTTTTALLQFIMKTAGKKAYSGGNIGVPLTALLDQLEEGVIAVEMSSFQLDTSIDFRSHICGLLNITPDHLDRHGSMESYIAAKAKIFARQDSNDYAIFNYEDESLRKMAEFCPSQVIFFSSERILNEGAFVEDGTITVRLNSIKQPICSAAELLLRGRHNLDNILCAVLMAYIGGVQAEVICLALKTFKGVRHRMEEVAVHNGIIYINDSKATNPESVMRALESFNEPIILIAGGRNKGSQFNILAQYIKAMVKELILLGEAKQDLKAAVIDAGFKNIHEVEDLEAAVAKSYELAQKGDVVMLSPACASWDMFANYEQRGDLFCEAVRSVTGLPPKSGLE